jgi:integrase
MTKEQRAWARQGAAFWRAHHEAWKRSELNQREYCEAEGIPRNAFGNWRAQFKAEPHTFGGQAALPPWPRKSSSKPPLRPKHVWSIRTKVQIADRKRDLAMFNLAIDSKLRGCDVVALKVEDIAPHGYAIERATVRQKKTWHRVRFEVTEQTCQAVDDYIRAADRKSGEFLFAAPVGPRPIDPAIRASRR